MPVPPLYKYSRRTFDLPEIPTFDLDKHVFAGPAPPNSFRDGTQQSIPVIFLYKASEETRREVCKKLEAGDGSVWPDHVPRSPLGAVPWLRSYMPSINAIFEIVRSAWDDGLVGRPLIFVDEDGAERETCVIWRWLYGDMIGVEDRKRNHEFARVKVSDAYRLICSAQPHKSWFPDTLSKECAILEPRSVSTDEWELVEARTQKSSVVIQRYRWPEHIPADFQLKKNHPVIISLVHLDEVQISRLVEGIGVDKRYGEVSIMNWTSSTQSAASEADMWYIFDRIKPEWPSAAPWGPVFGFFLASHDLSPQNVKLLVATRQRSFLSPSAKKASTESVREDNGMYLNAEPFDAFWKMWHAAWHPRPYNGSVRYSVLGGPSYRGAFAYITNPEIPVQNFSCGFPVFILQPISPVEEFKFRALLQRSREVTQFFCVPHGDGTVRQLIRYFQSPTWVCYQNRPPSYLIAIDSHTVETMNSSTPSFVIGTEMAIHHYSDSDDKIAIDKVGYVIGRASPDEEHGSLSLLEALCCSVKGMGRYIGIPDIDPSEATKQVERYYWDSWADENGHVDEEVEDLVTV